MQPGMTPTLYVDTTSTSESTSVPPVDLGEQSNPELVSAIFAELQALLGEKRYTLWIEGKIGLSICDDALTITVGSPFLLSWMQKQFKDSMTAAARSVLGHSARVVFAVDASLAIGRSGVVATEPIGASPRLPEPPAATSRPMAAKSPAELQNAILGAANTIPLGTVGALPGSAQRSTGAGLPLTGQSRGRRLAELNDFIAGPQTELALTAVRQVAAGQATLFNPLYIHGPVGSGKTHLLEGICRQLKRSQPTANVMLLTSEAFANYFTQALRDRSLPSFRQRFRGVDVLLVDDIEFFESKRVFQEEFLHTFADLVDHGRQVVLTGSRHPRLLTKLGDELATRFLSGLVCRLEVPDVATRQKIVDTKAARMTGDFAPEALQYIAQRFQGNVRELEGALNCLQTYHSMTHKRVTLTQARQILADLERDCLRIVRLADIERVICNLFGVKSKDLASESRVRTVSQPRMLAMFLARKHTQSAYTEIGQHFGGRNHSTVMSAERKVQQWLDENSTIQVASQSWTIGEILSTIEQQLLAG
ncbi:MAG TPA: chromosomal replication initiator protein DnaA [Schlesneria sp.]|jgi:chromosomal replication initiator protein